MCRLTGLKPGRIQGLTRRECRNFVFEPEHGWAYSFYDLISMRVVAGLLVRDVKVKQIQTAHKTLAEMLEVDRPFAHQPISTAGTSVLAEVDELLLDVGAGRQVVLWEMVAPELVDVDYSEPDMMAALWRPADGVLVDPAIQFGAPCVVGRRVETAAIRDMVEGGDSPELVAWALELDVAQVDAALAFEDGLRVAA